MTLAWLAFAWTRPAFPADALAPTAPPASSAQVGDTADIDGQPEDNVTFVDASVTAPATPVPPVKPPSRLRLAPIAYGVGGSLGYDIQQRTNRGGNALLQQRLALNLKGKARSYIWQPWIAKVNSDVSFIASQSKTNDNSSFASNSITGGAGLDLLPLSRYPFQASIARTQNNSGYGLGSPVSHSTRFDMNQRYRPRHGKENYLVGYNRSQAESFGDTDRASGLMFSMSSSRFKSTSIEADATRERDIRSSDGKSSLSNQATVHHRYLPNNVISLDNNASLKSLSEHMALTSTNSKNREINSTLTLQPFSSPFSASAAARLNVADQGNQLASSRRSSANLNLGANYRPSQYLSMSASANANVTEQDSVRTRTASTTQTASANYPLATIETASYRYNSGISGSLSNRTDRSGSTQNAGVGANHGLSSGMDFGGGRLSLGVNEGVSLNQSTRSQAAGNISHSGSANWHRIQNKTDETLRLSLRDSRSLSKTQDSYQSIDLSATIREELGRYSTLSGNLSTHAARQVSMTRPSTIDSSSSAALHYDHQRAFDVPRLIFNSDLRTYSQAIMPVLTATPKEQGPLTWENSLTYNIGRLIAIFNISLSKESDGTSQSLIALSLKRYF